MNSSEKVASLSPQYQDYLSATRSESVPTSGLTTTTIRRKQLGREVQSIQPGISIPSREAMQQGIAGNGLRRSSTLGAPGESGRTKPAFLPASAPKQWFLTPSKSKVRGLWSRSTGTCERCTYRASWWPPWLIRSWLIRSWLSRSWLSRSWLSGSWLSGGRLRITRFWHISRRFDSCLSKALLLQSSTFVLASCFAIFHCRKR